jgi:asparagine synthase (glutamine-hydrolysing)
LLRQVARRYLPAEIVDRPKSGFAIPIGEWFRDNHAGLGDMLRDHLLARDAFDPGVLGMFIDRTFVKRMLDDHLGTGPSGLVRADHSQRLYMLLVLAVWERWLIRGGR